MSSDRTNRIFVCALLALLGASCGKAPPDPIIDGQHLSVWIMNYRPDILTIPNLAADAQDTNAPGFQQNRQFYQNSLRARNAIRKAGTNAIPLLLDFMQRHDGPMRHSAKVLTLKKTAYDHNLAAEEAFGALGPIAKPAIPELRRIATTAIFPIKDHAARALASIEQPQPTQ